MLWKGFPSFLLLKKRALRSSSEIPVTKTNWSSILSPSRGVTWSKDSSSSLSAATTSITSLSLSPFSRPPSIRLRNLVLMLFSNQSYLSLRQEDRICCSIKMNVFIGDYVSFQFTWKFFKKIFKFIIQLIIDFDSLLCYTTFCETIFYGICCNLSPSIRRPCDGLKKVNWIYNCRGRTIIGDSWEHVTHKFFRYFILKLWIIPASRGCNREVYTLEETQYLFYCISRINFAGEQLRYPGTRSQFYSPQSFGGWVLCFLMSLSVDASQQSHAKSYYAWAINRNLPRL